MLSYNERLMSRGMHHLGMQVSDFDRSLHFYADILGFKRSILCGEGDSRAIMLDCGGDNYLELFAGGESGKDPCGVVVHIAFQTDDCAGAIRRLKDEGVQVLSGPDDCGLPFYEGASVRIAFFKGPDGENIELYQQLT